MYYCLTGNNLFKIKFKRVWYIFSKLKLQCLLNQNPLKTDVNKSFVNIADIKGKLLMCSCCLHPQIQQAGLMAHKKNKKTNPNNCEYTDS